MSKPEESAPPPWPAYFLSAHDLPVVCLLPAYCLHIVHPSPPRAHGALLPADPLPMACLRASRGRPFADLRRAQSLTRACLSVVYGLPTYSLPSFSTVALHRHSAPTACPWPTHSLTTAYLEPAHRLSIADSWRAYMRPMADGPQWSE